jgi:hypothetical protein
MARQATSEGRVTKMEAVRQAVAKLGPDAKPVEILAFIKETYGLEMSTEMAYNYKSTALKQARGGKKRGRKPGRKAAAPANGRKGRRAGITFEDIQAVKALTDRIGADKVRQLAEVLSK